MTVDVLAAVVTILSVATVAIVRVVWKLHDRVARLEGRLNGNGRR